MVKAQSRNITIGALLLMTMFTLAVFATFEHFANVFERRIQENLASIVLSKKAQVDDFLQERLEDGRLLAGRPAVLRALRTGNAHIESSASSLGLDDVVQQTVKIYGYNDIRLYDTALRTLKTYDGDDSQPLEMDALRSALKTHRLAVVDFHMSGNGKICFGVILPVFDNANATSALLGLVYLEIDAEKKLYPLLAGWPEKGESAETLLLKRQGNEIVYLSPLKFNPTLAPLTFRRSITDPSFIGLEETNAVNPTLIEGKDYRNIQVIGAAAPIAGTDWIVVAKIDHDEVAGPLQLLKNLTLLGTGLILLLMAVAGRQLWRARNAESMALQARLHAQYSVARKVSLDAYLVYDESGKLIDVNEAMEAMTGYSRKELLEKSIPDLNIALTAAQVKEEIQKIRANGGDRLSTRWQRKDGTVVNVQISASYLPDPAGDTFHSFAHDIGPEIESHRRLARLNELNALLSRVNAAIFSAQTSDEVLSTICQLAVRDGVFLLAWVGVLDEEGERVRPMAAFGEGTEYVKQLVITTDPVLYTSEGPTRRSMVEKRIIYVDDFLNDDRTIPWHELGAKYGIGSSAAVPVVVDGTATAVLTFYSAAKNYFDTDIRSLLQEAALNVSLALQAAEAKRNKQSAEQARKSSEELFSQAFDASPIPMQIVSLSTRKIKVVNKSFVRTFGYTIADIPDEKSWFDRVYADPAVRQLSIDMWNDASLPQAIAAGPGVVEESPELPLQCKNGSTRICRGFMTVIGDDIIVQWQDLSEIKQAEAGLIENERRFRSMIEQSLTGIYVAQNDRLVYVNPRFCEITGWESDELLGKESLECLWHDSMTRELVEEGRRRLKAGERSVSLVLPFTCKDGKRIDIGIHGTLGLWNGKDATFVIAQDITERKHAEEKIAAYVKQLEGTMRGTLQAVAKMVDMRDPYTAGHELRVGKIAADIAREMGWTEDRCSSLELIGLVHDIGKIAVPAEILSKPTRLTPLEYKIVQEHAEKGYEILKDVAFPLPIAEIIREHHERMDGSGYPQGLKGNDILPEARVLAVADVLESMASHRPYRPALGMDAAITEIEGHSGVWFDAAVVDAMLRLIREKGWKLPE